MDMCHILQRDWQSPCCAFRLSLALRLRPTFPWPAPIPRLTTSGVLEPRRSCSKWSSSKGQPWQGSFHCPGQHSLRSACGLSSSPKHLYMGSPQLLLLPLSFIGISPKSVLQSLIPSWFLLLRKSELTQFVDIKKCQLSWIYCGFIDHQIWSSTDHFSSIGVP